MAQDSKALFRSKAPQIMRQLMADFHLTAEDAAAVLGNLGHESGGFRFLQEKKPLIPGSRGGWGWAQWTAARRRAFEAWVSARGIADPSSDEANYGFLKHELTYTAEKAAIPAVKAAQGLEAKVKAFELKFERASPQYKHYPSRVVWARVALEAYAAAGTGVEKEAPVSDQASSEIPAAQIEEGQWPEDALSSFEVRAIQQRLRDLGYHQVGKVDGSWGASTAGAITALQTDRHKENPTITVDGHYGPQTRDELAKDIPRPISEARRNTTIEDLRKQGSETIRQADKVLSVSWFGRIGGFLVGIIGTVYEFAGDAISWLQPIMGAFSQVPMIVWAAIIIVVCVYLGRAANKTQEVRVEAERTGLHNGEPEPAEHPEPAWSDNKSIGARLREWVAS